MIDLDFVELLPRIASGDGAAVELLYSTYVNTSLRGMLAGQFRSPATSLDDDVQAILLVLVEDIRAGKIRQPAALPGYAGMIVRRRCQRFYRLWLAERDLESVMWWLRSAETPESLCQAAQRARLCSLALESLGPLDRDVVVRFYFTGEPREAIELAMGLTPTQFRVRKNRALKRMRRFVERVSQGRIGAGVRLPLTSPPQRSKVHFLPHGICGEAQHIEL